MPIRISLFIVLVKLLVLFHFFNNPKLSLAGIVNALGWAECYMKTAVQETARKKGRLGQ